MGICCSEQFYGTTSSSDAELIKSIEKPKNQKTIADPISKINAIAKTAPKLDISKNCLLTKRKEHTLTRSLSNLSTDGSPENEQQNNKKKNKKREVQRNRSLGPVAFKKEMDSFNASNQNQQIKSQGLHKQKSNKNQNCNIKEKSGIQ